MADRPAIVDADRGYSLIPEQASPYAREVDQLYYALMGGSALLVLILLGLIIVFSIRYRAGRNGPRRKPIARGIGHRIEIGFAVLLLGLFLGVFGWAARLYLDLYDDDGRGMVINVIGKQWMWKVQHPDGTREINTLHAPVGQPVTLRMTSQDVIHSFSVPALRLKRDVVPGMYTTARFEATQTGEFRLFCAEYCGNAHSRMRGRVVLMSRTDYQGWLDRNGAAQAPATAGRQLFQSYGCAGCHYRGGAARAPALDGLYGRVVPLAGGGTVEADAAYIRDAILRPQKHIVAGFEPIMPSYEGQISEDDIFQIIAYIRSLKPGDWIQDQPGEGTRD